MTTEAQRAWYARLNLKVYGPHANRGDPLVALGQRAAQQDTADRREAELRRAADFQRKAGWWKCEHGHIQPPEAHGCDVCAQAAMADEVAQERHGG